MKQLEVWWYRFVLELCFSTAVLQYSLILSHGHSHAAIQNFRFLTESLESSRWAEFKFWTGNGSCVFLQPLSSAEESADPKQSAVRVCFHGSVAFRKKLIRLWKNRRCLQVSGISLLFWCIWGFSHNIKRKKQSSFLRKMSVFVIEPHERKMYRRIVGISRNFRKNSRAFLSLTATVELLIY